MPAKKPKPPPDDPAQSERFVETAKQVEADLSGNVFTRAFKQVVKTVKRSPAQTKRR